MAEPTPVEHVTTATIRSTDLATARNALQFLASDADEIGGWEGVTSAAVELATSAGPAPAPAAGYVVAGPDVPGGPPPGQLVADWDGEVHQTLGAGRTALAACLVAGYDDWQLYALVPAGAAAAEPAPAGGSPAIAGRCPACRGETLFAAAGGHVTCSRLECPNPVAADDLLHGTAPTGRAMGSLLGWAVTVTRDGVSALDMDGRLWVTREAAERAGAALPGLIGVASVYAEEPAGPDGALDAALDADSYGYAEEPAEGAESRG